jgi:hypothetical protein
MLHRYNFENQSDKKTTITRDDLPVFNCKLPLQPNVVDCAIYALQNIASILLHHMHDQPLPIHSPNLYDNKKILSLRRFMRKYILQLSLEQELLTPSQINFINLILIHFPEVSIIQKKKIQYNIAEEENYDQLSYIIEMYIRDQIQKRRKEKELRLLRIYKIKQRIRSKFQRNRITDHTQQIISLSNK